MEYSESLQDLISLADGIPEDRFDFLGDAVYQRPLSGDEEREFVRLIALARTRRGEDPRLEPVYRQLLHLYVLNGGRLDVLSRLDRRLTGLEAGQHAVVLVSGPAGIGKTTLIRAMRPRFVQRGYVLVTARCPAHGSSPYALWRELVRAVERAFDSSASSLPRPIGSDPPVAYPDLLVHSLREWLDRRARERPPVILLDDLQWADEDSLSLLDQLTNADDPPPVQFIGTYRDDECVPDRPLSGFLPRIRRNREVERIRLEPWDQVDVERLTKSRIGPDGPEVASYLFGRTAGHPLFTVEILESLIERSLLTRNAAGEWLPPEKSVPVPEYLEDSVVQRVDRLGPDTEKLLSAAAVVGTNWSLEDVGSLVSIPEDNLHRALETAEGSGLAIIDDPPGRRYRFTHDLIREVLYERQPAARRRKRHEELGTLMEERNPEEVYTIARHFLESDNREKAARYSLDAGAKAAKNFAGNSALNWFRGALQSAKHAGTAFRREFLPIIYDNLGRALRAVDEYEEAEQMYSRMRDAARDAGDPLAEGRALAGLTRVQATMYKTESAEHSAREALELGERIGDGVNLGPINNGLAYLLLIQGKLESSEERIEIAERYAHEKSDRKTLSEVARNKAYLAIWRGSYDDGLRYSRQCLDNALQSGDSLTIVGGYQVLSYVQIERGEYFGAHQNMRTILDALDHAESDHHQRPRLLNQMGYLFLEIGNPREALKWDRRAVELCEVHTRAGRTEMLRYGLLNVATDHLRLGEKERARETVARFDAVVEAADFARFRYHNRYLLLKSEMKLDDGEYREAIGLARQARELALSNGNRKNAAKSHWLEGRALTSMHQGKEAVIHLEQAVAISDEIGHGSLGWRTRLSLASLLKDRGDSAREVIREARDLLNDSVNDLSRTSLQGSVGLSPFVERLEAMEKGVQEEGTGNPEGLTPREIEVLELVATGATDRQIADRLFISVRTVNTHLFHILNKTGCENRTSAAAFAIRHELVHR